MNVDFVSIAVIASVVAMIVGVALFINFAKKHMDEDDSSGE